MLSLYLVMGTWLEGDLVESIMGVVCHDLVAQCRPFMVVENVIVSARHRRRGIGKRLMEETEKLARQRDCAYLFFVSGAQRTQAHDYYKAIGYGRDTVRGYKKYIDP